MKGPKETTSDSRCGSRCVSSNDNLHAGWDPVGFHAISSRWKTKNRLSYDVRNFIFVSYIYFAKCKVLGDLFGTMWIKLMDSTLCPRRFFRDVPYKPSGYQCIKDGRQHWKLWKSSLIKQNPVANPCIICISHKRLRLPQPFFSTITIILYSQGAANWAPKWPWSCLQWSLSQPVATLQPLASPSPSTPW